MPDFGDEIGSQIMELSNRAASDAARGALRAAARLVSRTAAAAADRLLSARESGAAAELRAAVEDAPSADGFVTVTVDLSDNGLDDVAATAARIEELTLGRLRESHCLTAACAFALDPGRGLLSVTMPESSRAAVAEALAWAEARIMEGSLALENAPVEVELADGTVLSGSIEHAPSEAPALARAMDEAGSMLKAEGAVDSYELVPGGGLRVRVPDDGQRNLADRARAMADRSRALASLEAPTAAPGSLEERKAAALDAVERMARGDIEAPARALPRAIDSAVEAVVR